MKSQIFYAALFLAIGIYGIVHHRLAARKLVELGFINGKCVVTHQSESRKVWKSSSRMVYDQTVRFTYNDREETAVFVRERSPREEDLGKEIDIMISTKDLGKSLPGSLEGETRSGFILMIVGAAGVTLFSILAVRSYLGS